MGQKVNPHGLRVGVIKDWDSRWFTTDKKEFGSLLLEDHQIRTFLKERLYVAGVAKIEIERSANKIRIDLHVAKPGVVIGAAGAKIEALKAELEKTNNVDAAAYLGTVIGKKAIEAGIKEVVFDRGGFIYHGKVQALADAAREAGLEF